jgi:serine/threonine-protein kinase RsbW
MKPSMATDGRHSLEVRATRACVDVVHDLINAVVTEAGVDKDAVIRFESAAMEVVDNVIEHGGAAGPVQMSVTVEAVDGWLHGIVEDDGPPASVDLVDVNLPDPMSERGRGLAMAALLLDQFEFERSGHHNVWRLGVRFNP